MPYDAERLAALNLKIHIAYRPKLTRTAPHIPPFTQQTIFRAACRGFLFAHEIAFGNIVEFKINHSSDSDSPIRKFR